ncbi:potassium/proton antiporter [Aureivirga marina]|uniref:potassium/proton antiporter n=1 Tax=Aureivirga marina TaxID=1182451 RepID=UPI0018C8FEF1|nr:potassium/proton antiporter [Aureivirga marina]
MELNFSNILTITGVLLFIGVIINKPSRRYGIPGLILYLLLGFFIGNGGTYDFVFDYPEFAQQYSTIAISLIIYIGGLETRFSKIKPVLVQGITLSTFGVLLTAFAVGFFAYYFVGLTLLEGILLGSVLSSTDAAAVFSIFESKKLKLKENVAETLELESGTNDPVAYFMTIALTTILLGGDLNPVDLTVSFLKEVVVALAIGFAIGRFVVFVYNKLNLETRGLYPILLLSTAIFLIGIVPSIGGNLLLAMYIAGITIGNGGIKYKQISYQFFDSISWLMEISLFTILGLQIFPSDLIPELDNSLLITLFLVFIGRPIVVAILLMFQRSSFKKILFVSWVGLRGATPIVFGLIPLTAQVEHSDLIFNSVFIIVVFSLLIQGTTIGWVARKLNLEEEEEEVLEEKTETN